VSAPMALPQTSPLTKRRCLSTFAKRLTSNVLRQIPTTHKDKTPAEGASNAVLSMPLQWRVAQAIPRPRHPPPPLPWLHLLLQLQGRPQPQVPVLLLRMLPLQSPIKLPPRHSRLSSWRASSSSFSSVPTRRFPRAQPIG
jgi:hypothetical protein